MVDQEGLDLKKLEDGTQLRVETSNSVYQIVLDKIPTIEGGTRRNGDTRFPDPVPTFSLGSSVKSSGTVKYDWIGYGMRLQVRIGDGKIVTSPVENVVVKAKDDSWSYSLDWNK